MPVAVSLVILAGFAGAVWYAYNQGLEQGGHREIPLIEAERTPIKERPADPGGLRVPNQDKLVLNQGEAEGESVQVERLLPEPETPKLPEPAGAPEGAAAGASQGEAPAAGAAAPPQVAEAPAAGTAAPAESGARPQDSRASEPAAAAAPADAAPSQPAPSDARSTQTAQAELLEPGAVVIQLASVASNELAQREWARLQKAFPELLGDMVLAIQEVTVNGKQYHRMQTGPFPNRATAEDMCAQLKAKKQACLVTRR
jgi:cell division septation protein DedD